MDRIQFSDFQKLDIRIGTVIEAVVPEWSHWVMKLTVDLGPEIGTRIIFSGIIKHYKPEDLVGKQFPFVVNLTPKKIGPKEADGTQNFSDGMMIMAVESVNNEQKTMSNDKTENETVETPVLFQLLRKVPNGTRVS